MFIFSGCLLSCMTTVSVDTYDACQSLWTGSSCSADAGGALRLHKGLTEPLNYIWLATRVHKEDGAQIKKPQRDKITAKVRYQRAKKTGLQIWWNSPGLDFYWDCSFLSHSTSLRFEICCLICCLGVKCHFSTSRTTEINVITGYHAQKHSI